MCPLIVTCSFPSHVDFSITQKYSCIRLFHILSCVSGESSCTFASSLWGLDPRGFALGHPGTSIPRPSDSVLYASEDCVILQSIQKTSIAPT